MKKTKIIEKRRPPNRATAFKHPKVPQLLNTKADSGDSSIHAVFFAFVFLTEKVIYLSIHAVQCGWGNSGHVCQA